MENHDDYERGYDTGFQAGYVAGRNSRNRSPAPALQEKTGNGWYKVDDLLRDEWDLPEWVTEAYVIRDLNGMVVGVVDTRED